MKAISFLRAARINAQSEIAFGASIAFDLNLAGCRQRFLAISCSPYYRRRQTSASTTI